MKPLDLQKTTILIKSWDLHNVQQIAQPNQFRLYVDFDLDNYLNYNNFMTVVDDIKTLGYNMSCVDFYISAKQDLFSQTELKNIKRFEKFLDENNSTLFIKEQGILWNINEVQNTYNYIESCVQKIKDNNLSPLEQFLMAYKICCDHIYKEVDKNENLLVSRSIYGVTNTDKIVCAGHSNLLKEICNKLQNPNLKVYCCNVETIEKSLSKKLGRHSINLVELHDKKYNKNGIYHADSCWDSKKSSQDVMSLTYCLTPISDIKHFSKTIFIPDDKENVYYIYQDQKPQNLIDCYNEQTLQFVSSQSLVDEKSSREKFANHILDNLEMTGQSEKIEDMKNIFSTIPFKSSNMEYSFLRHVINKMINNSNKIEYQDYVDAITKICTGVEKYNILQAKNYLDSVMSKTLKSSFEKYIYGAKNPFFVLSCEKNQRIKVAKQMDNDTLTKHQANTIIKIKE